MAPQDSFWDYMTNITDDDSWRHENMGRYFIQFENNPCLPPGTPGHGFDGWVTTATPNVEAFAAMQPDRFTIFRQIAATLGHDPEDLFARIRTDAKSLDPNRDQQQGIFSFPFHNTALGNRTNADLLLAATLAEQNSDGSPANSLTIQLESLVTKVLFSPSTNPDSPPRAIGVEYSEGKSLYRADPRAARTSPLPPTHTAYARHSVILSAGVFNTPQLLKLSGIGPAAELARFGTPPIVGLPGVGTHLQDDYEISLTAHASVPLIPHPPQAPMHLRSPRQPVHPPLAIPHRPGRLPLHSLHQHGPQLGARPRHVKSPRCLSRVLLRLLSSARGSRDYI
ncbi:hypothetical protein B0T14DRAFT_585293 [Immersiella caudata]|uniref:Glucose-methanol-choline oxidoreductase N-terminal domain-containing protein n=1 Tax=Immersiella caudata TaxID=314043 RepID=A0AA39WQ96_9PEZI|nr:hypothetical protein B0T14DRAFT_585293 [Immersiella caudata]